MRDHLTASALLIAVAHLLAFESLAWFAPALGPDQICKAAIAAIMGRASSIIRIDRADGEVRFLSYVRADGTKWAYRCKLDGTRVIWAGAEGRWRIAPEDERIEFAAPGDGSSVTITQRFTDGSVSTKSFKRSGL